MYAGLLKFLPWPSNLNPDPCTNEPNNTNTTLLISHNKKQRRFLVVGLREERGERPREYLFSYIND